MKKIKIKINQYSLAKKAIKLPNTVIAEGEICFVVDAYTEGENIILGIETALGIAEAGFKTTPRVLTRKELEEAVKTVVIPLMINKENKERLQTLEIGKLEDGSTLIHHKAPTK